MAVSVASSETRRLGVRLPVGHHLSFARQRLRKTLFLSSDEQQAGKMLPTPSASCRRQARGPRHAPPLYHASVTQSAHEAPARLDAASLTNADEGVLARIKKCLQRAQDAGAAEQEAKAALRLASKMMKQLNITQADVYAHEEVEEQKKHGGQSTVALRRRDGDRGKRVQQAHYLNTLAYAMRVFFDCKHYTMSKSSSFETTFYGIAENTVAAAEAYCMVYNLMVEWARPYNGVVGKGSYCLGICKELDRTAEREKADEALRAKQRDEDELKERTRQEQAERQAQLDRLAMPSESGELASRGNGSGDGLLSEDPQASSVAGEQCQEDAKDGEDDTEWPEWDGFSDSDNDAEATGWNQPADFDDDDSENDSGFGDFNAEDIDTHIDRIVAGMSSQFDSPVDLRGLSYKSSPSASPAPGDQDLNDPSNKARNPTTPATRDSLDLEQAEESNTWASHMQLLRFRDAASSIADNYLKDQEIKLLKGRKRKAVQHDHEAYGDGVRDSKKIDVRMKSLPDGHVDLIRETDVRGP